MEVKIKKLNPEAILPRRGSAQAAGYDLFACLPEGEVTLQPGETRRIPWGWPWPCRRGLSARCSPAAALPPGRACARPTAWGWWTATTGGRTWVPLHNDSAVPQTIRHGDRVAQMVVLPYLAVDFAEAEELDETERGEGGFGSTGR